MGTDPRDFIDWLRDQGYEVCELGGDWYLNESPWFPISRRELEDLLVEYEGGGVGW